MKKLFILILLTALSWMDSYSQFTEAEKKLRAASKDSVDGWKKGALLSANFVQSFFNNWAAGGKNSIAFNGLVSLFANYKKGDHVWENYLDLGYGLLKEGSGSVEKTDDKIDLLSKFGKKAWGKWYYSALLNFRTQFSPGYNYPNDSEKLSGFLSPGYLLSAVGLDYKPNDYFSLFIAPITNKLTIVNDEKLSEIGAFGVDKGKKSRMELGGYMRIIYSRKDFKGELLKNISFTTKFDLFSNYLNNPQNIDVNWETLIGLKVNKFLTVNLNSQMIYDDDIDIIKEGIILGPRTQFKEIFGVGLSVKL